MNLQSRNAMPKILLAGHDVPLLETRAAVLKKTAAEVVYCVGPCLLDVIVYEKPDLVVLCHSLGRVEAEALSDKIHACYPKTKVLLVVSQGFEEKQYQNAKFDATILPDPVRLIERATELLEPRPHPYLRENAHNGPGPTAH
jgi:hypothetical protein